MGAGTTHFCVPIWEGAIPGATELIGTAAAKVELTAELTGVAVAKPLLILDVAEFEATGGFPRLLCPPAPNKAPGTVKLGAGLGGGKAVCERRDGRTWCAREYIDKRVFSSRKTSA